MRLHEDARLFLVGFAEVLARLNRFAKARIEIACLPNARAVCTLAAEIRQTVGFQGIEAVHRLRQHQGQRVFARSLPTSKYDSVRKMIARQHVAQPIYDFGITVKIRKHSN